jgi:hypothetical protein
MQKLITRQQAKSLGLKRYFTGAPCHQGHLAERMLSNARCIDCLRQYESDHLRRRTDARRATNRKYKRLHPDRAYLWDKLHPERIREIQLRSYALKKQKRATAGMMDAMLSFGG